MLKLYIERANEDDTGVLVVSGVAVVDMEDDCNTAEDVLWDSPGHDRKEGPVDVKVSLELSDEERCKISALINSYEDVFTDVPGLTNLGSHNIKLISDKPVLVKPYLLPFVSKDTILEEVRNMVKAGVIEPSSSPYCSPIVIVKKKDGTNRFNIDFRAVNKLTGFDAETISNADDIFAQLSGCNMCLNSIFRRVIGSYP
jgi:hypothetical protein